MLVGLTLGARAGDANLKDPIPDNLTWYGVTVYGAVDIDYTYDTDGAPLSENSSLAWNTIFRARKMPISRSRRLARTARSRRSSA